MDNSNTDASRDKGSATKLIKALVTHFPTALKPDYFLLVGADRSDCRLTSEQIRQFEQIEALMALLQADGLITADHYFDGKHRYFYNVRLTFTGYTRLKILGDAEHAVQTGLWGTLAAAAVGRP